MLATKIIVDNFVACCCFNIMAAGLVMSFKIMIKQCVLRGFKAEEKRMLENT